MFIREFKLKTKILYEKSYFFYRNLVYLEIEIMYNIMVLHQRHMWYFVNLKITATKYENSMVFMIISLILLISKWKKLLLKLKNYWFEIYHMQYI